MSSRKSIMIEIETLEGLRSLIEVYEEVAATRMQKVRKSVLSAREFLEEMLQVFGRVRQSYKDKKGLTKLARNGKTVAVFISANAGLFGDIVDRTFSKFREFVQANNPDVVVVGKLGVKMLADRQWNLLYNYYDFPDDNVDPESFVVIMRYLLQFEKIVVFYGKFRSVLNQEIVSTVVSGENIGIANKAGEKDINFLFEPSVEDIAKIMEGQVLSSVFEQTLHESQLAKFASRLFNLDQSVENVERGLGELGSDLTRLSHKSESKKQLDRMSGMSLWW